MKNRNFEKTGNTSDDIQESGKGERGGNDNTPPKQSKNSEKRNTYCYFCGIAGIILSAVAFGLSFLPAVGVYALIISVLFELAALAFLSAQKKRGDAPFLKAATATAYVLLALSLALFIGGLIYSATVNV